jgi:hypothetical protein
MRLIRKSAAALVITQLDPNQKLSSQIHRLRQGVLTIA